MKRKKYMAIGTGIIIARVATGINFVRQSRNTFSTSSQASVLIESTSKNEFVTAVTKAYSGFLLDNVLHSKD